MTLTWCGRVQLPLGALDHAGGTDAPWVLSTCSTACGMCTWPSGVHVCPRAYTDSGYCFVSCHACHQRRLLRLLSNGPPVQDLWLEALKGCSTCVMTHVPSLPSACLPAAVMLATRENQVPSVSALLQAGHQDRLVRDRPCLRRPAQDQLAAERALQGVHLCRCAPAASPCTNLQLSAAMHRGANRCPQPSTETCCMMTCCAVQPAWPPVQAFT